MRLKSIKACLFDGYHLCDACSIDVSGVGTYCVDVEGANVVIRAFSVPVSKV